MFIFTADKTDFKQVLSVSMQLFTLSETQDSSVLTRSLILRNLNPVSCLERIDRRVLVHTVQYSAVGSWQLAAASGQ
jgi:hypothetical protein